MCPVMLGPAALLAMRPFIVAAFSSRWWAGLLSNFGCAWAMSGAAAGDFGFGIGGGLSGCVAEVWATGSTGVGGVAAFLVDLAFFAPALAFFAGIDLVFAFEAEPVLDVAFFATRFFAIVESW
jgi:hypothetical protein